MKSRFGASRPLTDDEAQAFLAAGRWGTLSMAIDNQPYAVPVSYGYDGTHLYVAMLPGGEKTRVLDRNPIVCFTVVTSEPGEPWRSVIVKGRAEWIEELSGKAAAFTALRRQHKKEPGPSLAEAAQLAANALVLRIIPTEVTGRTREG